MSKPWYIDLATLTLAGIWMYGTITLAHQYGPSFNLIAGMVAVLIASLLVVHYRRIKRFEIRDWFLIEYHEPRDNERNEWDDEDR